MKGIRSVKRAEYRTAVRRCQRRGR